MNKLTALLVSSTLTANAGVFGLIKNIIIKPKVKTVKIKPSRKNNINKLIKFSDETKLVNKIKAIDAKKDMSPYMKKCIIETLKSFDGKKLTEIEKLCGDKESSRLRKSTEKYYDVKLGDK